MVGFSMVGFSMVFFNFFLGLKLVQTMPCYTKQTLASGLSLQKELGRVVDLAFSSCSSFLIFCCDGET